MCTLAVVAAVSILISFYTHHVFILVANLSATVRNTSDLARGVFSQIT